MPQVTVSAPYLQILLEGARATGVSVDDLVTEEVLQQIRNPDGRLDRVLNNLLWLEIPRRCRDDNFGLHLAQKIEPGVFMVVEYAARNASTLRQASRRFVRYCRLVHDGSEVLLSEEQDEARVSYTLPGIAGGSPRHAAEFVVAAWYATARQMTGAELPARRVGFQHPRPRRIDEHLRIFGCEVCFEASANEIVLHRADLDLPIIRADPKLGALLDRYAAGLLHQLPNGHTFAERVQQVLADGLCDGEQSLDVVARRLRMSTRTVQRRLKEEGTTFNGVVDELRREMALRYLSEPGLAIGEVAFLLGFSEPSAFHRAFKRWTGRTPRAWRRDS